MIRVNLKEPSEVLSKINLDNFPLVKHYIDYAECYLDKDWISYSIYYDDDATTPIAVVAKRLPDEQIGHVLIFEVDKDMTHRGLGTRIILDYIKDKEYWDLWSVESAIDFYKKLGFKHSRKSDLLIWGYED